MEADKQIFDFAIKFGLPVNMAVLLVAQARHETGNYTSQFFTKYNNAFGYSYVAGGKYQIAAGPIADNKKPIAAYSSLENSVHEIVDWIYRRVAEKKFPANLTTIASAEQYANLLKASGYYGDTSANYISGLLRGLNAAKDFLADHKTESSITVGGVIVVAMIYLSLRK